jgi:hypothetical protein
MLEHNFAPGILDYFLIAIVLCCLSLLYIYTVDPILSPFLFHVLSTPIWPDTYMCIYRVWRIINMTIALQLVVFALIVTFLVLVISVLHCICFSRWLVK